MPTSVSPRPAANDPAVLMPVSDLALVAQARHNPQAFGICYDRYVDAIFGYCVSRLGGRERAEDATSIIIARALEGIARCRGLSFRAWLLGIAHHVVIDFFRSTRGHVPLDAARNLGDPTSFPVAVVLDNQTLHALRAALTHLTPDQRQVIELRLAGLSAAEIGSAPGRTQSAASVAQHRAVASSNCWRLTYAARDRRLLMPDAERTEAWLLASAIHA